MKTVRFGLFIFVKKFLWVRPGVLQISGSAVPQFTRTSIRNPGCAGELWDRKVAKNSYFPEISGIKKNDRWNMLFGLTFSYFSKIIHFCQEILGILATIFIPEIQFSFLNFHFQIWILVFQIWLFESWILKFGIWILYIQ